ncbi:hypothetical protein ACO0K9_15520 [Undibacterium sp. Ji50W]|uniref:hypothetical protein n=1 Tax=Undibacterium sp. Ji50W TaxID=3413041 RepID=UPI003BF0ED4D
MESRHRRCVRDKHAPPWLDTDWLLGQFGVKRKQARLAYARFVLEGIGLASPLLATRHQLLLGDDAFVEKYQHQLRPEDLRDVSIAHRRAISLPFHAYQENFTDRNEVMAQAYRSGAYSMAEIAAFFSVHYLTVSRAVRAFEAKCEQ